MKIMWAAVTRAAQSILNWPSVADREDRAEHLELAERGGPGGARGAQATAVQLSKHQMKRTAAIVPVAVREDHVGGGNEDRAERLELAERGGPGGARGARATAAELSKHQMRRTAAMVPVAVRRSTSCSGGVNGEGGVPCPGG